MATAHNAAQRVPGTLDILQTGVRQQLQIRREKLEHVTRHAGDAQIKDLLDEVDAALQRIDEGTFGLCELCHEPIEPERLAVDPLTRFCVDDLPPEQQRALEADLRLASQIQSRLLPDKNFRADGWQVAFDYLPAGIVSGDYCDLLRSPATGDFYFALGDVSGKGVAASMLMSNLSAMFRALVPLSVPLPELMAHANRVFCESTLPNQYATLILGSATSDGEVEICNAGHLEPLLLAGQSAMNIEGSAAPIGLFAQQTFTSSKVQLSPCDALLFYSDGLSEANNHLDEEYGTSRLPSIFGQRDSLSAVQALSACLDDVVKFRNGAKQADDQTVLLLQKDKN